MQAIEEATKMKPFIVVGLAVIAGVCAVMLLLDGQVVTGVALLALGVGLGVTQA
jgi:hypothetical protein